MTPLFMKLESSVVSAVLSVVSLVCKKMRKNKTLQEIAEDLEEEISVVEPICNAVREFAD